MTQLNSNENINQLKNFQQYKTKFEIKKNFKNTPVVYEAPFIPENLNDLTLP